MAFTVSISPGFPGSASPQLIDLTGDKTDEVVVEAVRSPAGHDVLYVSAGGATLFRLCRPKTLSFDDRRHRRPKKKGCRYSLALR